MGIERREGSVIAGRFRLDRLLGQGGMGVVWAATNTATGRRVAIKMLRDEGAEDPHTRRRFLREGRAASAVQHPNVVEILDVLELEDQTPAMVMEMLDGESLGQRLRREKKVPLAELARIMVPALGAVGTAHAHGIVHRDLKPDNIFLAQGHEGAMLVKVLDFGIAKMTAEPEGGASNALTGTGAMLGTPYYMAPEQLFSDETLDYRCDIWALGIILYECLAGVRPTRGDTFADIVKVIATQSMVPFAKAAPGVPAEIADLVTRMLSFDKDKRPQSLREVCDVLQHHTDVLASSFGAPVLRPVKQSLDESGSGDSRGLKKSDVQFLVDSEHDKNASTITVDPLMRAKQDSQVETLVGEPHADTQGGVGVSVRAAAPLPKKKTGARTAMLLTAVGMAIGVTGVFVAATLKTSHAPVNAAPASPPPPAAVDNVAPPATVAAKPEPKDEAPAPAKSVAASQAGAAKADASKAAVKPVKPAAVAAPPSATAAAPVDAKTGAPGGLVEKPPF